MKILIINFWSRSNKGSAILVDVLIELLNRYLSYAEYPEYTLHSYYKDYSRKNVKENDSIFKGSKNLIFKAPFKLTIVPIFLLSRCFIYAILDKCVGLKINRVIQEGRLQDYYSADIVIPTGGDNLSEGSGFSRVIVFLHFLNILFAALFNKNIMICAESVGPFNSKLNKFMARITLNRSKLITLRDDISKKYLEDAGIDKPPIYVTADLAFLLEPAPQDRIKQILSKEGIDKKNRPLIGISPSKLIFSEKHYFIMAKVVDYLVNTLDATIIFIPHVLVSTHDDRVAADEICKSIKNLHKVISIKNDYTSEELKGIIGQCDLFIGARMHATIAATSMLVPTVGIAYSHKMHGIIGEMLGQERYVLDIKELDYESLISTINDAWENREKIRKELEMKIPMVKEKAMLNGKLVKELLDSLKPS